MISANKARKERQRRIGQFIARFVAPEKRREAQREIGNLLQAFAKCRAIVIRNRKKRERQQLAAEQVGESP